VTTPALRLAPVDYRAVNRFATNVRRHVWALRGSVFTILVVQSLVQRQWIFCRRDFAREPPLMGDRKFKGRTRFLVRRERKSPE